MKRNLIIGTRGSKMALAQTGIVAKALMRANPELTVSTRIISTKGDRNMNPIPLDTIGKTWFTKEIEVALITKEIDLAVHSFKDLAPEPPAGLFVCPVLVRGDVRDVLVPRKAGLTLDTLPEGAVIGTDSLRRKAGLLRLRPDVTVKSIRGNVQTRLSKLDGGDYDAIVLAAAGLERVGELGRVSEYFEPSELVPAIGQGVLAAEVRTADDTLQGALALLSDSATLSAIRAEQAFSAILGGGCNLPVGCLAELQGDEVTIYGMLGSDDAARCSIKTTHGSAKDAEALARQLAIDLKQAAGE